MTIDIYEFDIHGLNEIMLCPDIFPVEPPNVNPLTSEIASLNHQMEKMTIETHSQKLRQIIERTKRHRVKATLKRVKRDVLSHR